MGILALWSIIQQVNTSEATTNNEQPTRNKQLSKLQVAKQQQL